MALALDRYCVTLIDPAVGDALGTTLEWNRPGEFTVVTDIIGGGPFRSKRGSGPRAIRGTVPGGDGCRIVVGTGLHVDSRRLGELGECAGQG